MHGSTNRKASVVVRPTKHQCFVLPAFALSVETMGRSKVGQHLKRCWRENPTEPLLGQPFG